MKAQKLLRFDEGFNQWDGALKPTTYSDMYRFFENQNCVLLELSVGVWQPTTTYKVGDVVRSQNLGGYFARCITAGTSGDVEPIWAKDNTTSDASCKWAVYMPVLKDDLKSYVADAIKSALLAVFPVGTIIETKADVNPGTYIGGTWEELPANLCLQTGNASEAGTQRRAGLPDINGHLVQVMWEDVTKNNGVYTFAKENLNPFSFAASESNSKWFSHHVYFNASTSNPIYGSSDTVQPPAYMIRAWVRTA
jgi:hypothetical protein